MPRYEGKGRGFSLKDELFNPQKTALLASYLQSGVPGFEASVFEARVAERLPDLELKERIAWIADVLEEHLPKDFAAAAAAIEASLPPPLDPSLSDDDFGDFIIAPFGHFVATRGAAHFETSMETLRALTMRFSMEDPIRSFLKADPDKGLKYLDLWSKDDNYHVRRLVCEGTRPRLPWSGRLALPQEPILALLTRLHADKTRYVTRSVANHLNDIAKEDPQTVIQTLRAWHAQKAQAPAELNWITKHSLRTLIKAGHPEALDLLGFAPDPPIKISLDLGTPTVEIGSALSFSVTMTAEEKANVIIDYAIGFRKANGEIKPKVFKLKTLEMPGGSTETITKNHRLDGNATTYTLYPGVHFVALQVNGQPGPRADFTLV